MVDITMASACDITDIYCLCTNQDLHAASLECLVASCTVEEQLGMLIPSSGFSIDSVLKIEYNLYMWYLREC